MLGAVIIYVFAVYELVFVCVRGARYGLELRCAITVGYPILIKHDKLRLKYRNFMSLNSSTLIYLKNGQIDNTYTSNNANYYLLRLCCFKIQ